MRQKHKIYKKKLKVAAIDLTDEASELFEEKLSHFVEIDDTVKEEKFVANDEPLGDSTPPPADPTLQGSTLTVLPSEEQPDGCGIVLFMGERQPVPSTKVTSEDGESAEVGGATEQPAEKQGGATEQPAEKQPAPKPAPKPRSRKTKQVDKENAPPLAQIELDRAAKIKQNEKRLEALGLGGNNSLKPKRAPSEATLANRRSKIETKLLERAKLDDDVARKLNMCGKFVQVPACSMSKGPARLASRSRRA